MQGKFLHQYFPQNTVHNRGFVLPSLGVRHRDLLLTKAETVMLASCRVTGVIEDLLVIGPNMQTFYGTVAVKMYS